MKKRIHNKQSRIANSMVGLLIWVMLLVSVLSCIPSENAFARRTSSTRVVTVGWFESEFFREDSGGRRTGYAYEYLQKIAAYTGWEYRYVEGNWDELFEMMKNGEIDILADVAYLEERLPYMLFSTYAMGNEEYTFCVRSDNEEINPQDLTSINGKKVAVNLDTYQEYLFKKWVKANDVDCKIIEVDGPDEEIAQMLRDGTIDGLVTTAAFSRYMENVSPIIQIGDADFFFAINKSKPELKQELDNALSQILAQDRGYNKFLYDKYIGKTAASRYLAPNETSWLKLHGTIRIGYCEDYLPFSGTENNKETGILKNLLEWFETSMHNADVKFETIPYKSRQRALEALKNREVDAIFPMYCGVWDADLQKILLTTGLAESRLDLIIRESAVNEFDVNNPTSVAIYKEDLVDEALVNEFYQDWEIHYYNSVEECFDAVESNRADCLLISDYRVGFFKSIMEQKKLTDVPSSMSMTESFAVRKEDVALYSILNKMTATVENTSINSLLVSYETQYRTVSLEDFTRDNMGIVLMILITYMVLISILFVRSRATAKKMREYNNQLEIAKEAAERANLSKSTFLFNMSHDIRTPMNAIIGFTNLLEGHMDDRERSKEYVKKIKEASEFLLSLINNVLEMARIESGKVSLDEDYCNILEMIKTMQDVFEEQMSKKNLTFNLEIDISHPYVFSDEAKIKEILLNIISNAVKYTPYGGKITMIAKELPDQLDGKNIYEITISDTGIGMSKEFLLHIFENFERDRNESSKDIMGTGLGMAIVDKMVAILNGSIDVESELGKGSIFTVTLPLQVTENGKKVIERAKTSAEIDEILKGRRILLAEDNEMNATIASEILKKKGIEVDVAPNGVIAVSKLEQADSDYYDLVLMDVQMPLMDGYKATQEIRHFADEKKANIPIVAMTANAFEEDRQNAFDVGMNAHVAKPFDVDELFYTITDVLEDE